MRYTAYAVFALLLAGCASPDLPDAPKGPSGFALDRIGVGFDAPVDAAQPVAGGPLLVVEQGGSIQVLTNGQTRAVPFLDIESRVGSGAERGLLAMALDPNFGANGWVYLHYSSNSGDTTVSRFQADPNGLVADPSSEVVLLQVSQPYSNHNGGTIAFGPDGMLYVALGDGGGAGDPQGNGQNKDTLLGSILRIDPGLVGYEIPAGNPWDSEVYVIGVRNPWRISFDAEGALWVADVGQNQYEEVTRLGSGEIAGANLGWNWFEGDARYRSTGKPPSTAGPVAVYDHDGGHCSITGGLVGRDEAVPDLVGRYLFADYCSGVFWTLTPVGSTWEMTQVLDLDINPTGFAHGPDGTMFVLDHQGLVFQVTAP